MSDQPPAIDPKPSSTVGSVLIILCTLLVFGRVCTFDFTWWDDQGTVHHNPWLNPPTFSTLIHYWTSAAYGLYIPVTYTVWAAVASISRVQPDSLGIALNPWFFHTTNVIVHVLAALIAYRILLLLKFESFAATCGALLFAVHPIQAEAVSWVSGLKDVLCGMLSLLCLWQYVIFAQADLNGRRSRIHLILATVAFVLAMLAKPAAMALPLAAIAMDRWAIGRIWRRSLIIPAIWLILAIPIAIEASIIQDAVNTPAVAIWAKPFIAADALAFYLSKLVWPIHLAVEYGRSPQAVLAHGWCYWDWIFPAGLAAVLIAGVRNRPVLLAAGAVFVAGCLPVLGFTKFLFQFVSTTADHYLYFSMLGPAIALAWLLSKWPDTLIRGLTITILIACGSLTFRQTGFWQSDMLLFQHCTEINPASYAGFINLGGAYEQAHDPDKAMEYFRHAIELRPDFSRSHSNLADALRDLGRTDEAIAEYKISIELQTRFPTLRPTWPADNANLGELLASQGLYAAAIPHLETASKAEPKNPEYANALATIRKSAATQPAKKLTSTGNDDRVNHE